MKWLINLSSYKTMLKYLLTYVALLSVMIAGFFAVFRTSFVEQYNRRICDRGEIQLKNLGARLNDDIIYLYQVNKSMISDIDLVLARYNNKDWGNYETYKELNKYDTANRLVDSVVYWTEKSGVVLSTLLPVQYNEGKIKLIMNWQGTFSENHSVLSFDPTDYMGSASGELIFLYNDRERLLVYFPNINHGANYLSFYVIDMEEINRQMYNIISDEVSAVALVSPDKKIVTGINEELLIPYLEQLNTETGIYSINLNEKLCVQSGVGGDYLLVSILSNASVWERIKDGLFITYRSLLGLGVMGLLVIFLAMRFTYFPLHRMAHKIIPNINRKRGYIEQLEIEFAKIEKQKEILRDKLEKYRLFMQRSLLESALAGDMEATASLSERFSGHGVFSGFSRDDEMATASDISNIDQFFDISVVKEIFVVVMKTREGKLPCLEIKQHFQEVLMNEESCVILEFNEDRAVFLLNFSGPEGQKGAVLRMVLNDYYEENGYFSAISNGSSSALDIPSLYKSALAACECWPRVPVVDQSSMQASSILLEYPYEKIKMLSERLVACDFDAARMIIDNLFDMVENLKELDGLFGDFYIKSVLVDMLTVIANAMENSNIKFKVYSDLYFDALHLCPSGSYSEKKAKIQENVYAILDLYEQNIASRIINAVQIRTIIEESFCQPDFSVTILADHFHVGVAYMSYLVKKELGTNFSEALWLLRLEKAKQLLRESSMSVEEIGVAVGYLNVSSFRRKFKQEIGLSPSKYRDIES